MIVDVMQEADGKAMKGKRSKEEIQQRNKAVSCSLVPSFLLYCPAVCAVIAHCTNLHEVPHIIKVYVTFAC